MPTNQSQILLFLLALLGGAAIGAIVAWLLFGREKESPPDPDLQKLIKLRQQYQERVSLWAERRSGKLMVRIDDQMASTPEQLSEDQRKQLQTLMREWLSWMGFPGSATQALAPEDPFQFRQAALVTPGTAQNVSFSPALRGKSVNQNSVQPMMAGSGIPGQPAVVPQPLKSIVEQINEILQENLINSPACNKGVRLVEDPKLGAVVWIGLEHFNGVEAVVDPDVKAVLKASVVEWEHRAGRL